MEGFPFMEHAMCKGVSRSRVKCGEKYIDYNENCTTTCIPHHVRITLVFSFPRERTVSLKGVLTFREPKLPCSFVTDFISLQIPFFPSLSINIRRSRIGKIISACYRIVKTTCTMQEESFWRAIISNNRYQATEITAEKLIKLK